MAGTTADRWLTALTLLALFVAGAFVGIYAAFLVPLRLFGGLEGLADVVGLVGTIGIGVLGAWGTRTLLGAVLPGVAVLIVLGVASMSGPGNDLVLPGRVDGDPGVGVVAALLLLCAVVGVIVAVFVSIRILRRTAPATAVES